MNPEVIKAIKDDVAKRQTILAQSLNVASAASNDMRESLIRAYRLIDELAAEVTELQGDVDLALGKKTVSKK